MNNLKINRHFQLSLVLGTALALSACSGDGRPLEEAVESSELNLQSIAIVQASAVVQEGGVLPELFVDPGQAVSFSIMGTTREPATQVELSAAKRRWSVDRPDLASIDENGVFTGIAEGIVEVSVRVGGLEAEDFPVTIAQGTLTGIQINQVGDDPLERCLPQTFEATGTFTDTSSTGESTRGFDLQDIEWSTPDETLGTVVSELDGTATVTAFNAGMLTLNAMAEGLPGSETLMVGNSLQGIDITPPEPMVMERTTVQLSASGSYMDMADGGVTMSDITDSVNWSIPPAENAIATVSNEAPNKGLVSGVAVGPANVSAVCGSGEQEQSAEIVISVIQNDGSASDLAFEEGDVATLSLSGNSGGFQLRVSTGSVYDADNDISLEEGTSWRVTDGGNLVEFRPDSAARNVLFPTASSNTDSATVTVLVDGGDDGVDARATLEIVVDP